MSEINNSAPTAKPDDILIMVLADIRAKTGVGNAPMLSELADAIASMLSVTHASDALEAIQEERASVKAAKKEAMDDCERAAALGYLDDVSEASSRASRKGEALMVLDHLEKTIFENRIPLVEHLNSLGWLPPEAATAIRDKALEDAANVIDGYSEFDAQYCCNGRECGCYGETVHGMMKHFIRALKSSTPSRWQEVPEGWVVVPMEPTPKMIAAAWAEIRKRDNGRNLLGPGPGFKEAFRAMIGAAEGK